MQYLQGYLNRYNIVVVSLTLALWYLFAPPSIGGFTTFVLVNGISMQPIMFRGDLAIIRRSLSYQVGDVVTYNDPVITQVIHRIVGQQAGHFVMRGDNNNFLDSYQPTSDEIVGKLWFFIPGAGTIVLQLKAYLPYAIALCLIVALLRWYRDQQRNPKLSRRDRNDRRRLREVSDTGSFSSLDPTLLVFGAVVTLSFLLALAAYAEPLEKSATIPVSYDQTGDFSYTAPDHVGIYDNQTVKSGQPFYRAAGSQMDLTFHYALSGTQLQPLGGTYRLAARVRDANGSQRTLELAPDTPFNGGEFTRTVTLDLRAVQGLIVPLEQTLALKKPGVYRVDIVPSVQIMGINGDAFWQDTFTPWMAFNLDAKVLTPIVIDRTTGAGGHLLKAQKGELQRSVSQPATLSILGLALPVTAARVIAGLGLAVSVLLAAGRFILLRRRARKEVVPRKYLPWIVSGTSTPDSIAGKAFVDVLSLDDLMKLARKDGHAVLYTHAVGEQRYTLITDPFVYQCVVRASGS